MFSKRITRSSENTACGVAHLLETIINYLMAMFREKNIPGASLNARDPSELKVPELRCWLSCSGGTPQKGKKADLVTRFIKTIPYHVHVKKDLKHLCLFVL